MIPVLVRNPGKRIIVERQEVIRTPFGVDRVAVRRELPEPAIHPFLTVITCTFLHGGWLHLIGNLWILYIFGDNVEDRFGHLGYLVFYLACGFLAGLAHLITNLDSATPTVGASGAIAGVMGAYFFFHPHARVLTLVPVFLFYQLVELPAFVFLGFWFVLQFFSGTFALAGGAASGVAWWAHIGGFVVGYAIAASLDRARLTPGTARGYLVDDDFPARRLRKPRW
jgi:hypothetical protein